MVASICSGLLTFNILGFGTVAGHRGAGESVLRQPVTQDGYRAIKLALGHACREFESSLTAEAAQ